MSPLVIGGLMVAASAASVGFAAVCLRRLAARGEEWSTLPRRIPGLHLGPGRLEDMPGHPERFPDFDVKWFEFALLYDSGVLDQKDEA